MNYLLSQGLETKPHQLDLLRNDAELRGTIGQLGGQMIQTQQSIAQTEHETLNASRRGAPTSPASNRRPRPPWPTPSSGCAAANDQLERREITAPEAGT